jgi:SAM-dependent methyltransferase
LTSLERYTGPGHDRLLLDVGAYVGVFVQVALAAGWHATGVEPSRWAVNAARQSGITLIEGTLDAEELHNRRFDVLTMWDVIEHLADPSAELVKAYRLLNPGGVIAVHTMDIASPTARMMGRRWPWLMDMHIHYFSRLSLIQFLEKAGFEIIWSGAQGRYLSLGYLATRVGGMSRPAGRLLGGMVNRAGKEKSTIPVNFGDLFTIYARRPKPS